MATGRLPDPNTAPLTAKGDLYTYSTVPARLAVGNNGETLVADSSASTGLRWQGNFAAGKNKIINGDFSIWQRGNPPQPTTSDTYTADRWFQNSGNNTDNFITRQTFTPGTAPVAGYEGEYYLRWVTNPAGSGGTFKNLTQRVEDVRTLSGQTVTLSFWAKADAARDVSTLLQQNFGSGGSASVNTSGTTFTLTTSWARYSTTVTLPSVAGKTIGSSSFLRVNFGLPLNTAFTIEFWGVQLEAGNVATAFQTATGTLAGELAACQRYYWRFTGGNGNYAAYGTGLAGSTTQCDVFVQFPTTMRTRPTTVEYSTLALGDGNAVAAVTSLSVLRSNELGATLAAGASSLTQYRPHQLLNNNNSTTAYLGVSAEL